MELAKKLNLKAGYHGVVVNPQEGLDFSELFWDMMISDSGKNVDFALLFVRNQADLATYIQATADSLKPGGLLWVTYPKGASKVETDLNRDILYALMTEYGWEAVRQVAMDDVWSAMRFKPLP